MEWRGVVQIGDVRYERFSLASRTRLAVCLKKLWQIGKAHFSVSQGGWAYKVYRQPKTYHRKRSV
jgi:hypothetical protein